MRPRLVIGFAAGACLLACRWFASPPPDVPPVSAPIIVIHVRGMVLDAGQLPREVPIAGATVTVSNLRGVPAAGAPVQAQTDSAGWFDLRIPMAAATYPYWWGQIDAQAPGYGPARILCCEDDPTVSTCTTVACHPGTGGFYKLGLLADSTATP